MKKQMKFGEKYHQINLVSGIKINVTDHELDHLLEDQWDDLTLYLTSIEGNDHLVFKNMIVSIEERRWNSMPF